MRSLLLLFVPLAFCMPLHHGAAQTLRDESFAEGSRSTPTLKERVAELRSLLVAAGLDSDNDRIIEIATRLVKLTDTIDITRRTNFLLATDRLSAFQGLYTAHASLAHEELAAEAQEQVVAITEVLYGADSRRLLGELDELAFHLTTMGRNDKALSILDRAVRLAHRIEAHQDEVSLLCQIVNRKLAAGQYHSAADDLRAAETLLRTIREKDDCDTRPLLIEYYLAQGCYYGVTEPDPEKAIDVLERRMHLMEATPRYAFVLVFLPGLYSITGQYDEAERCIRKQAEFLSRHPMPMTEPWLLLDRGYLLLRRGRYDDALETLKEIADFEDGRYGGRGERECRAEARRLLAQAHIERGDYAEALQLLQKLRDDSDPLLSQQAAILSLIGRLHLRQKNFVEADQYLCRAFHAAEQHEKENPDWLRQIQYADFLRDLIQLYRETNRPEKAEEIIKKSGIVEGNTEPPRTPKESHANE